MAIWQVTPKQRLANQEIRNVLFYDSANDSFSNSELQDFADDVRGSWSSTIAGRITNQWSLYAVDFRRVDEVGWPTTEVGFTLGTLNGAIATGDFLPTSVAMLVHGTTYAQPPNRVRSYLVGLREADLSAGLFVTAALNDGVGWAASMDTLTAGSVTMTRVAAKWDRLAGYVTDFNAINNYFASNVPAHQRRRRIGRGI